MVCQSCILLVYYILYYRLMMHGNSNIKLMNIFEVGSNNCMSNRQAASFVELFASSIRNTRRHLLQDC